MVEVVTASNEDGGAIAALAVVQHALTALEDGHGCMLIPPLVVVHCLEDELANEQGVNAHKPPQLIPNALMFSSLAIFVRAADHILISDVCEDG